MRMPPERLKLSRCRGSGRTRSFARLWKESGIREVVQSLLGARRYEFDVERAVYNRLFASAAIEPLNVGSEDYLIPSVGGRIKTSQGWLN